MRVIPRHIQLAVRNDEELNRLLGGFRLSPDVYIKHHFKSDRKKQQAAGNAKGRKRK